VVFVGPDWRTTTGQLLTNAEIDALRQTRLPRRVKTPFDRAQPVASPATNNPAYRPGGEAIVNAPPIGIASVDNPISVETAFVRPASAPVDNCLREKGLTRNF
jgi:hypothetical protein